MVDTARRNRRLKDGLSIRLVRGALPTTRTVHYLDFAARLRLCSFRLVHLAASRHHLLPLCDPDLRASLHTRNRGDRLGVVLGDSGRAVRHQPLGGQLHPAEPDLRDPRNGTLSTLGLNARTHSRELSGLFVLGKEVFVPRDGFAARRCLSCSRIFYYLNELEVTV